MNILTQFLVALCVVSSIVQLIQAADAAAAAGQCAEWSYSNAHHGVTVGNWMTGGCCLNTPGTGNSQSPIDIDPGTTTFNDALATLSLASYNVTPASAGVSTTLVNNGHTAQLNFAYSPGFAYNISGGSLPEPYILSQLHFHWGDPTDPAHGSEHKLWGVQYPLEVHFVHYRQSLGNLSNAADKAQGLAVLGFFYKLDTADNSKYTTLVDALHSVMLKDQSKTLTLAGKLTDLIPADTRLFYRYSGSLTTPKCYESVIWSVFHNNIPISAPQLASFMALHDDTTDASDVIVDNFRPVQPLNGRVVQKSVLDIPAQTTTPSIAPIGTTKQAGGSGGHGNGISVHHVGSGACVTMVTTLLVAVCNYMNLL